MFYCVNVEFYDCGKVLACVTSSEKMGLNQSRGVPGMRAFKIWFVCEAIADDFANGCKSGQYDLESLMRFYGGMKDVERTFPADKSKKGAA
jgi:hypothetical protein